jgi:hypothetical protein
LVLRYLSESWAEQALQQVESDERVLAATRGLQLSLLAIILNAPKDAYGFLYVAFDGEGLQDYRVGHDYGAVTTGMPNPTFVVSGDYAVFAAIQRGEITERRAILTGKLHLTGSLVKALRHMRALETVTASLRTIACET